MEISDKILEELNEVAPLLATIHRGNIFSIPKGFFDDLPNCLYEKKALNFLQAIPKIQQTAPAHYFEKIAQDILAVVKSKVGTTEDELKTTSPVLLGIRAGNPMVIPEDYFTELPLKIIARVKPESRVHRLQRRTSRWQFARAAVMTGTIALSALMVYNNQAQDGHLSSQSEFTEAKKYISEQQLNEGISKLPDEDIIKYLENNGTATDNESFNTSIDAEQLPDKTTYPNDNKLLYKFLESDSQLQSPK